MATKKQATEKKSALDKDVKRRVVELPKDIAVAPLSEKSLEMEYMNSTYPIGFGYTEKGNAVVIAHSENDKGEIVVIEHLITPRHLERIIEIANDVLDRMGRNSLGLKEKSLI